MWTVSSNLDFSVKYRTNGLVIFPKIIIIWEHKLKLNILFKTTVTKKIFISRLNIYF